MILVLVVGLWNPSQAQKYSLPESRALDSLNAILQTPGISDTAMAGAYLELSEILYVYNVDTVLILCNKAIELSKRGMENNRFSESEKYAFRKILAGSLNNVGFVYYRHGDVKRSQKYYYESLTIEEELGNKSGIATGLANMALIHISQGDTISALDYFKRSLAIEEEINNEKAIAAILNNLGTVYSNLSQWEKALHYFSRSLTLERKIKNREGIATNLNNIGILYNRMNQLETALAYFNESLNIAEQMEDEQIIATVLNNISEVHLKRNDLPLTKATAERSLKISEKVRSPRDIGNAAKVLSEVAEKERKFETAYRMYQLYEAMEDSMSNEETQRETIKQQARYEYEKKHLVDSVRNEERQKLENISHEKKIREKNLITYMILSGLAMVMFFLIIIYYRLKVTKKQKIRIEEAKNEIVSSINYAKRIQTALLRSEEYITESLPPHFVLFIPKEIVSGDFYWVLEKEDFLYMAVADCTGHGVPGALLTMLGTSFLNEINSTPGTLSPAEILEALRSKFVKDLSQSDERGANLDGMDISLLRLNRETLEVLWAGANNPLYIMRTEESDAALKDKQLEIIKGDSQPIGFSPVPKNFENHEFQLAEGDLIYMFSDGFADQFGGPEGKKLGYRRIQEEIWKCYWEPMDKQKNTMYHLWKSWKKEASEEQTDDVCMIGMRIEKTPSDFSL